MKITGEDWVKFKGVVKRVLQNIQTMDNLCWQKGTWAIMVLHNSHMVMLSVSNSNFLFLWPNFSLRVAEICSVVFNHASAVVVGLAMLVGPLLWSRLKYSRF